MVVPIDRLQVALNAGVTQVFDTARTLHTAEGSNTTIQALAEQILPSMQAINDVLEAEDAIEGRLEARFRPIDTAIMEMNGHTVPTLEHELALPIELKMVFAAIKVFGIFKTFQGPTAQFIFAPLAHIAATVASTYEPDRNYTEAEKQEIFSNAVIKTVDPDMVHQMIVKTKALMDTLLARYALVALTAAAAPAA